MSNLSTMPESSVASARALGRLATVALVVVVGAALSYAHPSLYRFRPWVSGDALPFASLMRGGVLESEREDAPAAVETPMFAAPVVQDSTARVNDSAAQSTGTKPLSSISADLWRGLKQPIDNPSGHALDAFFAELRAVEARTASARARIAHYGDSTIASDRITYTVRRLLQQRFGDSGHGFMLASRGTLPYGHRDITHSTRGRFTLETVVSNRLADGRYGYGGALALFAPRASATYGVSTAGPVGTLVSRATIYLQRRPAGGTLRASFGGQTRMIETAGTLADSLETFEVPEGAHSLEVAHAAGGAAAVYGVALERDTPGVVYDSLGLVGARTAKLLNFNAEHIAAQLTQRSPKLLVIGLGGNDASDGLRSASTYRDEYVRVLRHMRRGIPNASCLVFAPLDQAQMDERGVPTTFRAVPVMVESQRAAAAAEGCAFFDTFRFMGGSGAMARWVKSGLGSPDFRHASPSGYERIGQEFFRALMKAYADYLAANPSP